MFNTKRQFQLLSTNNTPVGVFTGSSPHQAAKKAASRGYTNIMLREHFGGRQYDSKVHMYRGGLRPLHLSEATPFAVQHGMHYRPKVVKVGTLNQTESKFRIQRMANGLTEAEYDDPNSTFNQEDAAEEKECGKLNADTCGSNPKCMLHKNGTCFLSGGWTGWHDE